MRRMDKIKILKTIIKQTSCTYPVYVSCTGCLATKKCKKLKESYANSKLKRVQFAHESLKELIKG